MQTKMIHSSLGAAIRRISRLSAAALLALSLVPLRAFAAAEFPPDAVAALANLASTQMDANAKAKGIQDALNNISGKLGRPALAASSSMPSSPPNPVWTPICAGDSPATASACCAESTPWTPPSWSADVASWPKTPASRAPTAAGRCGCCWRRSMARATRRNAPKQSLMRRAFLEKHAAIAPRDGVEIRYRLMRMRAKPATPRCAPPRRVRCFPTAMRRPQSGWTRRRTWPLR